MVDAVVLDQEAEDHLAEVVRGQEAKVLEEHLVQLQETMPE